MVLISLIYCFIYRKPINLVSLMTIKVRSISMIHITICPSKLWISQYVVMFKT